MKKSIIISLLFSGLIFLGSNVYAQCSQSGTTASCTAETYSTSYVSYSDYYYPCGDVPVAFQAHLYVYGESDSFAAVEIDWGSAGMWWNTIYSSQYHTSFSGNADGYIWLWTSAANGKSVAQASWSCGTIE